MTEISFWLFEGAPVYILDQIPVPELGRLFWSAELMPPLGIVSELYPRYLGSAQPKLFIIKLA